MKECFFFFFIFIEQIIIRYKRMTYKLNGMRQSAYLVFNSIMVDNNASFFNCTPVGRTSDSMMTTTYSCIAIYFSWLRPELLVCCFAHRGSTGVLLFLHMFSDVVWHSVISIAGQLIVSLSPRFWFIMVFIIIYLFLPLIHWLVSDSS